MILSYNFCDSLTLFAIVSCFTEVIFYILLLTVGARARV